ncbi:MAG: radical SAM/SPASM domain-containing protein [Pseudomonadota bacterium]
MEVETRMVDVELTNRCNALCSFCPRPATPDQGFMSFDTFKQSVARIKELAILPNISLTGQGESTLHPQLVEFVQYAANEGLYVEMTTNANLLTKDLSQQLIDAGLGSISFSVSDFGDDYEIVYNLDFETTRRNIMDFLELRDNCKQRKPRVVLSIVEHDLNRDKIAEMKKFWESAGIKFILEFPQNNRGGACDNGHYFIGNDRFEAEAKTLLQEKQASPICSTPFFFVFIGWNGQYYVCCSDYRKETPLGSVFDHSIDDMDKIKLDGMVDHAIKACADCNVDPVNAVREKLFEIEAGAADSTELDDVLEHYSTVNNQRLPKDIDILTYADSRAPIKLKQL